ncbi:sugar phosphate isomerase/epimerase family protein [Paenibacillus humicola]|uniref:sugar phosphate isomerase/epimerase family protein n=1 Tax=Paenibacillus humicola TaxID=3110540 RepID=UPI00237A51C5|nr:sugar phosphate isomerase/epimerase [Paenibacillus humicola]
MAVTLTGFADEISPDLDEQLAVLQAEGISHLELRSIGGTNVLKLTDAELEEAKAKLSAGGFRVSSVGSPIGKYGVRDDFAAELEHVKRACDIAAFLEAPYIRVFSYFIPGGENHADHRGEVVRRMKELAAVAESRSVTLLLENESAVYGDTDDRCLELLEACRSPRLRLAFDPGNFVMNGVKPVSEALPKLKSYIEYVHVKDAAGESRMFVPAGAGDGELAPFIRHLKDTGFHGFLSVEPHLHKYYPELDNPSRFVRAVRALKGLLDDAGLDWN